MPRNTLALELIALAVLSACASTPHGTVTPLTTSASDLSLCEHKVPAETCTRCHPDLIPKFQAANDWCAEHEVAESQCLICHPDLTFDPLPTLPPDADFNRLSNAGEEYVLAQPRPDERLAVGVALDG